jgi:carotenoid cleavage dioxygenase-like enzyme
MTDLAETPTKKTPWHLAGNFAPVFDESDFVDLEITGSIPKELDGLYVRNGANPKSGKSPHWFFGNGMLHGVRLADGSAQWYKNRYVHTPLLDDPNRPFVRPDGTFDREASAANTHVICHAGRILALEEGHFPWELDSDLNTISAHTFGGKLNTAMTAHPKVCPETGEMMFFGYGQFPPYLTYHRVSAAGELVQSTDITVPGPTMMHDFNSTRSHVIFMDLPVVFDLEVAMTGSMPYLWSDTYGARLGVMPRDGVDADVRWFEVEPGYVFHPMNSFERQGRNGLEIVIDVGRFRSMWRKNSSEFEEFATLHRWIIDMAAGVVREEALDDRPAEFARVADDVVGLPNRYGYMTATRPPDKGALFHNELLKYDVGTGECVANSFGPGRIPGEGVFAPGGGAGRAEDDGWVLTFAYDQASDRSDLVILDATNFAAPPVATIRIPRRVPFGFHGSWVPASQLPSL